MKQTRYAHCLPARTCGIISLLKSLFCSCQRLKYSKTLRKQKDKMRLILISSNVRLHLLNKKQAIELVTNSILTKYSETEFFCITQPIHNCSILLYRKRNLIFNRFLELRFSLSVRKKENMVNFIVTHSTNKLTLSQ